MNLPPVPLQGRFVRLEPLVEAHREALAAALDCDPETWNIYPVNGQREAFPAFWRSVTDDQAAGLRRAYAVRRLADDEVVGLTCFLALGTSERTVEIGATFLRLDARGGPVNPEMKRLMLAHAFEHGALRVAFQIDARNLRSQAAVAKLGAVREGVLRRNQRTWTGHVRDTVVFSILDEEWPAVRERLDARLETFG